MNNNVHYDKSNLSKLAKNTGRTFFGVLIGKGLFILTQVIIARQLGVEAFGIYTLGFGVVWISGMVARMGLPMGGIRFISIFHKNSIEKASKIFLLSAYTSIISGVLVCLGVYFLSTIISDNLFNSKQHVNYIRLFALSIPLVSITTVISYNFSGLHTTKYTVYIRDFIQPVSNIIMILILLYLGFGLEGAIYAFIGSYVISLFSCILFAINLFPEIRNISLKNSSLIYKELISYSMPLMFIGIITYLFSWINVFMIGFLASPTDAGIFRAAAQFPMAMTIFLFATNSIYSAIVAEVHSKNELDKLSKMLKSVTRWNTFAIIPIFTLIFFSSSDLMQIFGEGFSGPGNYVVIILSVGTIFNCLVGNVGTTLIMTGKEKFELYNTIFVVLLSVIINFWMIPKIGVIGAAITQAVSFFVISIIRVVEINIIYKITPFTKSIVAYFIPTFIVFCILYYIRKIYFIELNSVTSIIFNSIVILIVFFIYWVFAIKHLEEDDKEILDKIRNRISNFSFQMS